jgi:hypothetical protein
MTVISQQLLDVPNFEDIESYQSSQPLPTDQLRSMSASGNSGHSIFGDPTTDHEGPHPSHQEYSTLNPFVRFQLPTPSKSENHSLAVPNEHQQSRGGSQDLDLAFVAGYSPTQQTHLDYDPSIPQPHTPSSEISHDLLEVPHNNQRSRGSSPSTVSIYEAETAPFTVPSRNSSIARSPFRQPSPFRLSPHRLPENKNEVERGADLFCHFPRCRRAAKPFADRASLR